MSIEKFLNDDFGDKIESENEKEELHIRKLDYKDKVDSAIKSTFHLENKNTINRSSLNLMDIKANDDKKKIPMSVYFNEADLMLLKAIAFNKNTTVSKIIMNIIKEPLDVTRDNLNMNFNIKDLAKKYDKNCRKTKKKAD